jgi:hypothetical protein
VGGTNVEEALQKPDQAAQEDAWAAESLNAMHGTGMLKATEDSIIRGVGDKLLMTAATRPKTVRKSSLWSWLSLFMRLDAEKTGSHRVHGLIQVTLCSRGQMI